VKQPRYATPRDLVEGLHDSAPGARGQLAEGLREPLARLMDELVSRHKLAQDRGRLTLHALHAAETYLRTRPREEFARLSWPAFRGALLLQVARLAFQPFGVAPAPETFGGTGPAPLPESPAYQSQTFFLPHDRVGGFWFGGDWYGGRTAGDGALWVVVADVTGHGYFAYLLASVLPGVWEACWKAAAADVRPVGLLTAMHQLLESCLPDGVFVECTLARLTPDGEATLAPAGGTRFLLRRRGGRPDLKKLRGAWLGLHAPHAEDQHTLTLADGDELLLGTDGAFDSLADHGGDVPSDAPSLLDAVRAVLREALRDGPQKDDITLVLLRRRPPLPGPGGRGPDDVPV
jgi:hypothetical protein